MSLIGLLKAPSHVGTEKLAALVDGKRVALVGNAQSLFGKDQGRAIDDHDVVIRLNRGFIIEPTQQGSRTDIVGTARPLSLDQLKQYNAKFIYWLFWRWWRIPTWNEVTWQQTEVVPVNHWRAANATMRKRPTSGFVMAHVLAHHTRPAQVSVFGFDFYTTGNFYRGNKISKSHDHDDERFAFEEMMRVHGHVQLARSSA